MASDDLDAPTLQSTAGLKAERDARTPALTVLAHPTADRVGDRAWLVDLLDPRGRVPLSRTTPDLAPPSMRGFAPLADPHVSRKPIWLEAAPGGGVTVSVRETSTRVEIGGETLMADRALSRGDLEAGVVVTLAGRIVVLLHLLGPPRPAKGDDLGLIGASDALAQLRDDLRRVADTDVTVLLRGETGSGKELAARAIHALSTRRARPYLAINMSALPPSLAASELFGHEKGAFSGAARAHRGIFARADRGTLFMDEVGDTPPEVQAMLLRTLETGEIQPVGSERSQRVDVRLVAATDANLEGAVASEDFRAPLLHRLSGFVIGLPPLRARRDDLGRLLYHFLRRELAELGEADALDAPAPDGKPWLSAALAARLAEYSWPGNVRELVNAARQIAIASRGRDHAVLPPYLERTLDAAPAPAAVASPEASAVAPGPDTRRPSEVTEDELIEALRANKWLVAPTAAQLGLARPSVYDMIERSDRIRKAKDLTAEEIVAARDACGGDMDAMSFALEVSKRGLLFRIRTLGLE